MNERRLGIRVGMAAGAALASLITLSSISGSCNLRADRPADASGGVWAASGLTALQVATPSHRDSYDRDRFAGWRDGSDRDPCDTREEVLTRDLTGERVVGRCEVVSGTLRGPYTLDRLPVTDASEVHIDHVVALADAWDSGAWAWSAARRDRFANDQINLLAAVGRINLEKSDSTAAHWRPPARGAWCNYSRTVVETKTKYQLTVTEREKLALADMLRTC